MAKSTVTAPTAASVREFYRSNEKRMGRLSPEAQATLAEGARGRLHPQVISDYNRGRKPERRYVLGATRKAGEARAAARAKAAEAGVPVGKRGPLSKAAKAALSNK